jgi:hypothetical protein
VAARRLIVVMLALLVVSSIAAALAPVRDSGEETTGTTTQVESQTQGRLVRRTIDTRDRKPASIAIDLGDQLELTVKARRLDQVEIAALGELEPVDPDAPAHFDLLPRQPGTYDVRLLGARRVVGSIEVTPRKARKARRSRDGREGGAQAGGERSSDSPGSSTIASMSGARSAS